MSDVPTYQPTVAVDFDGTLYAHEYPNVGAVKDGAREALELFRQLGYRIVIWSCRTSGWNEEIFNPDKVPTAERHTVVDMKTHLDKDGIPYDEIDMGDRGKPLAEFYIDDKAVRFLDNWSSIAEAIRRVTL